MKPTEKAEAAIKSLFETMTAEIFSKAGVLKEDYPKEWDECTKILSMQMAKCSALYGLTEKRVQVFEKQKQALVDDMVKIKKRKLN